MKIVLATNCLARYPEGGGLWNWFLDYPLGLKSLGHDVFWIEILHTRPGRPRPDRLERVFFDRARQYGLGEQCALLLTTGPSNQVVLKQSECCGRSREQIRREAEQSDILWNMAGALQGSLLTLFRRRAFVDGDPGHLHVSALNCEFSLDLHHVFLTTGLRLADAECEVPRLGREWRTFPPFVHLPLCPVVPPHDREAPFTTVTQWNWRELWWGERALSVSKREAYLRYVELPRRSSQCFELAANIAPDDATGDRELLHNHGWRLVHPHDVAQTPEDYQSYIAKSRGEFCCPKPVFRELRTGWFSDRSAHYLATGRPVLAEKTGFEKNIPTGKGLSAFQDLNEAVDGVREINADYQKHCLAARALAEEFLDAKKCLAAMLAACG